MRGKRILLGISGGIAAYKCAYLVRELSRAGADVRVVMTDAAKEFITPLTFSALTRYPVATDLWSKDQTTTSGVGTQHIDLATWCDLMVIAPATANTIAKLAHGLSDNLVTVLALACRKPVVVAPTMDADMYIHDSTQRNISILRDLGYDIVDPDEGEHASGLKGPGRLPEVETLLGRIKDALSGASFDLKGKRVLVTAGPTYEAIDPVRFVGNRSSGKMGFAIAAAAARRGAKVTLVAGPVSLRTPRHVERIDVETAVDMLRAVKKAVRTADITIMAAAVADYAPTKPAASKMKKSNDEITLALRKTPDILSTISPLRKRGSLLAGFALETENAIEHARMKLKEKKLDLIVANTYNAGNPVFGSDRNKVTFLYKTGALQKLPSMEKSQVAERLLDALLKRT